MYTKTFWLDILERAVGTFSATLILLAGTNSTEWLTLDWYKVVIMSLIAAGLTVVKGLGLSTVGGQTPTVVYDQYVKDYR